MDMGKSTALITITLITLGGLQGCSEPAQTEQAPFVQPVKTLLISPSSQLVTRQLPGVIDANRKVELSFRVSGKLQQLKVKESDMVDEGSVIAQLDKTDYQIALNDKQASYQEAQSSFERGKQLLPQGYISKNDYDRLEAAYKSARAAMDDARQQLAYTTLKAPFSGRVAKRLVENFQEIQSKQAIIELQDLSSLEVIIDIPENQVKKIRGGDVPEIYASFSSAPEQKYPLIPKEFSTVADPQTQTFRARLKMDKPEDITVLPGMTTSVTMKISSQTKDREQLLIPNAAISADSNRQPNVWIVDQDSMTVSPRPVKVGELLGSSIEVLEGIEPGERIVIAGVSFLAAGQQVALMPEVEQAEPLAE